MFYIRLFGSLELIINTNIKTHQTPGVHTGPPCSIWLKSPRIVILHCDAIKLLPILRKIFGGKGTPKKLATATQPQFPRKVANFKQATGFQISRHTLNIGMLINLF
jgi:hypothetical protein